MNPGGSEVGCGGGVDTDPIAQAFELSSADVGQPLALGSARGPGVQEDGNAQVAARALGELHRERDALIHRDVAYRHERYHVRGAHARVLAGVGREIDARRRHLHGPKRRLDGGRRRRDEREHRAVVRRVGLDVEQLRSRHGDDRRAQRGDHVWIPALGKVRHAFDQR